MKTGGRETSAYRPENLRSSDASKKIEEEKRMKASKRISEEMKAENISKVK